MNATTMTYMMWREEHLWNISVLQRVNISSLVMFMCKFIIKSMSNACDGLLLDFELEVWQIKILNESSL
jgi:hypothetical protein